MEYTVIFLIGHFIIAGIKSFKDVFEGRIIRPFEHDYLVAFSKVCEYASQFTKLRFDIW